MTELLSRLFIKNSHDTTSPQVRARYGTLCGIVGIVVNFILAGVKLLLGTISHSVAITADALNNLSDAGASVITFVTFKISSKPADRDHPYGHARIEYVASMIVSFMILLVGANTLFDAFSMLIGKSEVGVVDFSVVSIVVLAISVLLKLWLAVFYKTIGKKVSSETLKASSVDSFSDCISTTAVLIGTIVIKLTNWYIIDAIFGLIVSLWILYAGIGVLNQTKNSILGTAPIKETVDAINSITSEYSKIIGIHDLMVHSYGPSHTFASFHAEVDGKEDIYELHDMIDNVERRIQDELKILCCIHLDPIVMDDEKVSALREFAKIAVNEIDESISIHDFRTVIGATHTNLIFDIVLPFESKYNETEIVEKIQNHVQEKQPNYFCVITVDRG